MMDAIITQGQLLLVAKELDAAKSKVLELQTTLDLMINLHTELKPGMRIIVNEEGRNHLGGAPGINIGHHATINRIFVSTEYKTVECVVDYDDWGSNVQSLKRVQAMRNDYVNSLEEDIIHEQA